MELMEKYFFKEIYSEGHFTPEMCNKPGQLCANGDRVNICSKTALSALTGII